jgi:hypothetical protein
MFFKKNKIILIIMLIILIIGILLYNSYTIEKFETNSQSRTAYLLTCDETTERSLFSKNVLESVGFNVVFFQCIKNEDKVLSNKISMQKIYEIIANGQDEWVYVFEDDINILDNTKIDELIEYEKISSVFFYLGVCGYYYIENQQYNTTKIRGHDVAILHGEYNIKGLHAIALSKDGAKKLLEFSQNSSEVYMDVILNDFSKIYNPHLVRLDLQSNVEGDHRGLFFQDRNKFPTTI